MFNNFSKLGENLVMKAIADKVKEVKPEQMLKVFLAEAHGLAEQLKQDLDGDGKSEMQNIQEDLVAAHEKLEDAFERLAKAQAKAK